MDREEFEHEYDIEELQLITSKNRDFKMLVTPGFYAEQHSLAVYEYFTSGLLLNFLKGTMLFVDVGAHYGYYTILIGTKRPDCKIMAFEPVPENFEILNSNVALNQIKNVEIYNLAVSDKEEVRKLKVAKISGQSGFYEQHGAEMYKEIEVKTVRLDEFLEKTPRVPTVIKIDVEGHEHYVLQGMKKFLRNSQDVKLIIEFNPDCLKNAGFEPAQFLQEVYKLGFDLYVIDDDRRMTYKLGQADFERWSDYLPDVEFEKTYTNILCIKKKESLSVLFFSHSSKLTQDGRSLLALIKQAADNSVVCSVVLPNEGPLRGKLDELGASTLIIGYHWWCNSSLLPDKEIMVRLGSSFENVLDKLGALSKINPDVIFTNTLVIPWGGVAASFLGKPHAWFVGESDELKFYLPLQTVLKVIKSSSARILVNSNAIRNTLFGAAPSKNILTFKGDFAQEKTRVKVFRLLRKLKGKANPRLDALSQFAAQATLTNLRARDFQIAELKNALDAHIKDTETKIGSLEMSLQEKVAQIANLELSVEEKISQIDGLISQIQQIQRSIPMQLANRCQRVIDRLLPPDTRRRHYYKLGVTGIWVILNEGWRSFWNKFRQRYKRTYLN